MHHIKKSYENEKQKQKNEGPNQNQGKNIETNSF